MSVFKTFIQVASENGFTVVVRGHPARRGYEKMYAAEDLEWKEFCDENRVVYLPSNSKMDTYKLLRQSEINVVYGSTVGIDSIFLGQNTLVLGNVDWGHLVPEICAFDEQSIRERFKNPIRIVDVERIYPYAFFMESGGIEFSSVEFRPDGSVCFEGKEIEKPRFPRLQKLLKR
jgi:capsule polysaccharide modification protein KpsS